MDPKEPDEGAAHRIPGLHTLPTSELTLPPKLVEDIKQRAPKKKRPTILVFAVFVAVATAAFFVLGPGRARFFPRAASNVLPSASDVARASADIATSAAPIDSSSSAPADVASATANATPSASESASASTKPATPPSRKHRHAH